MYPTRIKPQKQEERKVQDKPSRIKELKTRQKKFKIGHTPLLNHPKDAGEKNQKKKKKLKKKR